MFLHIIHYDWLALRASRQLLALVALLTFFVGLALWNGQRHVNFQRQTLAAIRQADARNFAQLTAATRRLEAGAPFTGLAWENPQDAFRAGTRLASHYPALPPAALALVAVGQSDLLPYYYKPIVGKLTTLYHPTEIANADGLYDGSFDLAFVLTYLVPLLVIALSYNLLSAEREQRTLPLLLTSGSGLGPVLLGKYVFRWLLLNGVFDVLVGVGLLVAGVPLSAVAGELGLLWLLVLGYSAFWFALAFWVNSRGYDSGTNAAILVGTWLGLVLLVPALLGAVAEVRYPMPARSALLTRTRDAVAEAKKTGSRQLARYFEDHPELALKGPAAPAPGDKADFAQTALRTQLVVAAAVRPLEAQFDQQRQRQQTLITRLRLLSPAIFVQQSLSAAAGTDATRYADFEAQVGAYTRRYEQFFVAKVFRHEPMRATDYARLPDYHYQPLSAHAAKAANLLNLSWLLALTLLLTALGLMNTRVVQLGSPASKHS